MTRSTKLADTPWWVNAGVKFGAPTVLAGYLVWVFVGRVTDGQDRLLASFQQHQQDMAKVVQHLEQESEQSWVMAASLSRICINTAKSDADRVACISVQRKP